MLKLLPVLPSTHIKPRENMLLKFSQNNQATSLPPSSGHNWNNDKGKKKENKSNLLIRLTLIYIYIGPSTNDVKGK